MSMNKKHKLELTWIGKENRPRRVPRILADGTPDFSTSESGEWGYRRGFNAKTRRREGAGMAWANVFMSASSPRPSPPFKAMEERVPRAGDGGRYSESAMAFAATVDAVN
jgi:hypothetical protein